MDKNSPVATVLKQIAAAAFLLGSLGGIAQAQIAQEVQSTNERPEAFVPAEQSQSPRLPNIVNARPESRNQQQQQMEKRPAKVAVVADVFGEYVNTVTGAKLQIFGKELFTDVPTTFAPFDAAQVNGDYVIGAGDELQIRGWGMINVDVTATVDRGGSIYIPQVGAVKVAGIKYRDLQGHLKQAIGRIFSNFELTASISQTRALQIYVVGHAVRPGTYTLNSMSTLLNAVFTSGGPSAAGSMRNIQLKRGGSTVGTFDLYDMLVRGDKSGDLSLRDGDVIYIPETGPLVALTGNVKTPAIFEMKGQSSLADVIAWAGGIDSSAQQKQIIVEKTVNNVYQTMTKFVADQGYANKLAGIPVQPTDVIRVFAPASVAVQAQLQHEYVRVSGEVKQSGIFELRKGETLRELMVRIGGTTANGYVYGIQLKRESLRQRQQQKLDEVAERFERDIESSSLARLSATADKDAVALQTVELERQRRIAEKLRSVKAEGRIVLELEGGSAEVKHLPDLALQDGDNIVVPRKPGTVDVLGAVFQPNSFIYKPNRVVNDYISMAGGETATSDTSEVYIIRADGTAQSGSKLGWLNRVGGTKLNAGDTIVVPEKIDRSNWRQTLKEWTAIFYQFGLGAAGLKVLQN
ncbi:SLBB domain-containing protein [Massilia alkalitolerans]|uniref:SLBB domain-containing protein n=1 Tax=Massilia alkalitolerans TaxID=286638 RepID=UPI0009FFF77B|nr:SLBB domain-containing protein [Massilia alkalitolerans]